MSEYNSEATYFEEEEEETESEWEVLKANNSYEINVNYPHVIRKRSNQKILKESMNNYGYLQVKLNGKPYLIHRLIALQWIPNPNNLPYIDHINNCRTDNRIENLFWCSHEENQNNLSGTKNGRKVEFVDEIPDDAIYVEYWNQHRFSGYYFSLTSDLFYRALRNGKNRVIPTYKHHGYRVITLTDINKKQHEISYDKFLSVYNLN